MDPDRDWPTIVELMRTTPMSSNLPAVFLRNERFHDSYPSFGDHVGFVAEDGHEIVSYIHGSMAPHTIYNNGPKVANGVYLGDVRTKRSHQGRGILPALGAFMVETMLERGAEFAFGVANEGNDKMMRALANVEAVEARVLAQFQTSAIFTSKRLVAQLPTWFPAREVVENRMGIERFEPFEPSRKDAEALAERVAKLALGPLWDVDALFAILSTTPALTCYRHVDRTIPGIAFATWDLSDMRRVLLDPEPSWYEPFRRVWNAASPVIGSVPLGPAAEGWRMREVVFARSNLCASDVAASCMRDAVRQNAHLLVVPTGASTLQPFRPGIRLAQTMRTDVVFISRKGAVTNFNEAPWRTPFLDLAML
jgi:hypothetical protein